MVEPLDRAILSHFMLSTFKQPSYLCGYMNIMLYSVRQPNHFII